jgi:hypothetical protein
MSMACIKAAEVPFFSVDLRLRLWLRPIGFFALPKLPPNSWPAIWPCHPYLRIGMWWLTHALLEPP